MTYRTRQRLFAFIVAAAIYALIPVGAWWTLSTDDPAAIVRRAALLLVPVAVLFTLIHYWPTRRRPGRLYQLTTRTAAEAATTAVHDDGTVTVCLRHRRAHRRWPRRARRPIFFFPRPPTRRDVIYWNLRVEPDVYVEVLDVEYDGVQVGRRLTGAYRLRGLVAARARIQPFPPRPGTEVLSPARRPPPR